MRTLTAAELQARIDRVRELHKPVDMNGSFPGMGDICSVCAWEDDSYARWPCDTIRVLDGGVPQ